MPVDRPVTPGSRSLPRTREAGPDGRRERHERELDDVLGIEVPRVRGEGRRGRMLDALVDGQDRDVARAAESPMIEQRLQAAQHLRRAIALSAASSVIVASSAIKTSLFA